MEVQQESKYGGYKIRLKSERVRPTDGNQASWKPAAEVWKDTGDSLLVQSIEPEKIQVVSTKEEADKVALQTARSWIEKRSVFGEHLTEAVQMFKQLIKKTTSKSSVS